MGAGASASVDGFVVTLDGKAVAVDGNAAPLALSKGQHTLSITVSYKGTLAWVQARLLDPDRKLTPEK